MKVGKIQEDEEMSHIHCLCSEYNKHIIIYLHDIYGDDTNE